MVDATREEPFPWQLGIYDAHCHPTDTMSSIQSMPNMKTRVLTVMATRVQDQELVASIAESYGVRSSKAGLWSREECIIPCFGWHPWFAHQMYISSESDSDIQEQDSGVLQGEEKIKHYSKVFRKDAASEEDRCLFLSLPDPMPFSNFLAQTRTYLEKYPYALVGEIGLDRGIRIPEPETIEHKVQDGEGLTPGSREGRKLTSLRPDPQHQKQIFKMQLQLAAELGRAVSIHGVQAHGMLFETVKELFQGHERKVPSKRERKKMAQDQSQNQGLGGDPDHLRSQQTQEPNPPPYPPRICLHSYSGDFSNLTRYLKPDVPLEVFASFSTAVNLSDTLDGETPENFRDLIKRIPDHLLLVESDLHIAGEDMDRGMEDILRRICRIKGWELEEGVKVLGANWKRFVFGNEEK
ncbi:Metallo-dependent hydrolase [Melanomma pulvis-pyrius CBS 109.77]|uniref:Metallo-dependent hydrolase n=1 Tax=Melanomma pulvis-pyrius CBS 109.77 TaxID=1314802 RepID=A0A6A6WTX3_9PLEO|nr:Metallo-dependent hydrolase [Melanomma pulvis-pyrius CBS 109.77]